MTLEVALFKYYIDWIWSAWIYALSLTHYSKIEMFVVIMQQWNNMIVIFYGQLD